VAEYLWGLDPDMTMSKVVTGDPHSYTRDTVGVRDILFYKKSDEQIAAEVRLVPTEKMNLSQTVADYLRFVSKTMNFGLLYGGGAGMLSKLLHIDKDSAGQLAMAWRGKYVAFPQANKKAFDDASDYRPLPSDPNRYENYVIQPIIGRARRFTFYEDAIVSKSWPKGTKLKDRTAWNAIKLEKYPKRDQQRKAFNNIIQGMGGGIANQSALRAVHALKDLIRPFLLVHDSFDFYCPAARLDEVIGEVQHIMTDWPTVPKLVVSTEVSDANWQEARKYVRS
jgi:DNA polymerase I-like protein with 3'-5' exonuclease and polymerase domains